MTADRLAELIAVAYNDWEGSTDSGMTMEEYVAARLIAAGVTVAQPAPDALRAAAQAVVTAWGPPGGPEWDWMNRRIAALRAALGAER